MPLPVVLSSCVDAISNRLEELVCHCQELHRENQTLQMENASLRLQQAGAADRRPQVPLLVLPPEVQTLEARVKEVFLEPEQSIELPSAAGPSPDTSIMLPGRLPHAPSGPIERHPWLPEPEGLGSPTESDFRMLGVPSRATTKDLSHSAPEMQEDEADVEYVDAKSMHFDTLVSHRLQLITDTKLADDGTFLNGEWQQTWTMFQALESEDVHGMHVMMCLVNSVFFKAVSMIAIMANAVYIGLRTDQQIQNSFSRVQGSPTQSLENSLEYVFLAWFTIEVVLHLTAYRWHFFVGSPFLAPSAAPGTPGSMKSLILDEEAEAQELDIPYDLPDPQRNLPPEIVPVPFIMVARFDLCCELDLKEVAFSIRHAEYNPRKHTSITVRLLNPRVTALVRHSGRVMLSSSAQSCSEEALKKSAKKVARLVQRAGNPTARFTDYRISSILCKADLGFPVRLDQLATKFRRNALYEPEFFSNCVFRTKKPKCTYLITAGGKVSVSGLRTMDDVREALRRAYFVFREFRT